MCGIAGIINFKGLNPDYKENLVDMTLALAHRGPDFQDEFMDSNVGFGHRRLSIIDLSSEANQPMISNEKDVVVVFNGEIYNHAELRKSLESKYEFRTNHSDTDVIIYAYKEWGIECVKKFVGMFTIALYDIPSKKVFLVRDRIGQKSINYCYHDTNLLFSSEIHALEKSGLVKNEISSSSIYHYLTFLTAPAGESFYSNVSKVKAGHIVEISDTGLKTWSYWNVTDYLNEVSTDREDTAIEQTEALLNQAMIHRNVSDVPVSLALSGGIDSSLNAYYSNKINPDLTAINISFDAGKEFNEGELARKYCDQLGIPFHLQNIDSDDLKNIIRQYLNVQSDVPNGDPNAVLMFHLSQLSRDMKRIVLLVGEGGDEIGGYPKYLKHFERFGLLSKAPNLFKQIFNLPFIDLNKMDIFHGKEVISHSNIHGFTESEKKTFWSGEKDINSYEIMWDIMKEVRTDTSDQYLRRVLNLEYKLRLPEMILARIDYPSAAASIEARSPFADHKLIEYSCTTPFDLKMKNGEAKYILKKIARQKLPPFLMDQKKIGFGQLLNPFLIETLPIWFEEEVIQNVSAPIKNYIEDGFLKKIQSLHSSKRNMGFKMWILYALNTWLVKHQS
jgi:asparagine synthase (glutamine-hydrolysing)